MATPLWQTFSWEQFQKALGHSTERIQGDLLILLNLPFGWKYGYIPRGPRKSSDDEEKSFWAELQKISKKRGLVFVRIDPEEPVASIPFQKRKSHSSQPETTLILDLSLSEEKILAQMKRKGRYNIGLAEKKGIEIKKAKNEEERKEFVKIFFSLLKETTNRDEFSSHEEDFYQTLLKTIPESEIFLAYHEAEALAGAIVIFLEQQAIYYYGASTHRKKEFMAPYALQWSMIRSAKAKGCKEYDFLGIAPEGAPENHPWRGITEFKKKFGGVEKNYPQPQDLITSPWKYRCYGILKAIQKILRFRKSKKH